MGGGLGQWVDADGEVERGAGAGGALRADASAHEFTEPFADGQAETGAAEAPRGGGIDLTERFEEAAQALRTGQPLTTTIAPELLDTFVSWANIYAGLDPVETKYLLSLPKTEADLTAGPPAAIDQSQQPSDPRHDLAHNLWRATLAQLQLQMTRQTFDTWLKPTEVLDYRESVFVIDAKSAFAKDWLENKLVKTIELALSNVVGEPTRVRFALRERFS